MLCMLCACHNSQCSLVLQVVEVERVNTFMAVVAQVLKCHVQLHNTSELIWLFFFPLSSIFLHLNNISKNPQFLNWGIPGRFHRVCIII